jgi:hypothetical protein
MAASGDAPCSVAIFLSCQSINDKKSASKKDATLTRRFATQKAGDRQFCLPETQPLRGLAILLRKVHSRILIRCAGIAQAS